MTYPAGLYQFEINVELSLGIAFWLSRDVEDTGLFFSTWRVYIVGLLRLPCIDIYVSGNRIVLRKLFPRFAHEINWEQTEWLQGLLFKSIIACILGRYGISETSIYVYSCSSSSNFIPYKTQTMKNRIHV